MRYRRDLGDNGSSVGLIYTGREGAEYSNRVGGADALIRLTDADSLRTQVLVSREQYPRAVADEMDERRDAFGGAAYGFLYQHETRNWAWELKHGALSPELRLDSGFESQVGVRNAEAGIERKFFGGPKRWFNQITIGASGDRSENWEGHNVSYGCDFPIEYSGPRQMSISYNPACNHETFEGKSYDNFRQNANFSIRPSGSLSVGVNASWGGAIDFANSQKADQLRFGGSTNFNIARGFEGNASYSYQKMTVAGGRLFTAQLFQFRGLYHLNLRTFVRAIVQFTDVDRNVSQYSSPVTATSQRAFTQLLFSYKLNPQTVVLVGYSDNASGSVNYDLTRSDRTFFLKLGYALVF